MIPGSVAPVPNPAMTGPLMTLLDRRTDLMPPRPRRKPAPVTGSARRTHEPDVLDPGATAAATTRPRKARGGTAVSNGQRSEHPGRTGRSGRRVPHTAKEDSTIVLRRRRHPRRRESGSDLPWCLRPRGGRQVAGGLGEPRAGCRRPTASRHLQRGQAVPSCIAHAGGSTAPRIVPPRPANPLDRTNTLRTTRRNEEADRSERPFQWANNTSLTALVHRIGALMHPFSYWDSRAY